MTSPYIAVVGGANMDLSAKSGKKARLGDSNPGTLRTSPGGVGRNIAQALTLMGAPTVLVTALGRDVYGSAILEACQRQGICMEHVLQVPDAATSCYVSVTDCDGQLLAAVADMDICEKLTPTFLKTKLEVLNGAALVVLDTNLSREALAFLCETLTVPIFCDPVSVAKAERLTGLLGRIHTLKPNCMEAALLSGVTITGQNGLAQAGQALLEQGVQNVFISRAERGFYCCNRELRANVPACPTVAVSDTGGGDSAMAALAWAHLHGQDTIEAAALAAMAAALTLASEEAVSPLLGGLTET